jgi:hypothetical protein
MDVVLCVLAKRLGRKRAIALFAISFVCSLCMGYLSSKDFTQAFMNWMAEIINVLGQGSLLLGVITLHKAGLADADAAKKA